MNPIKVDKVEMLREMYKVSLKHVDCAKMLIQSAEGNNGPHCNIALFHLSAWIKLSLKIVCLRFAIEFQDDDSIETLFDKTEQLLPVNISEMKNDMCHWHNAVQYESKNIMTADETYSVGCIIERFFNKYVRAYANEIRDSTLSSLLSASCFKPLEMF